MTDPAPSRASSGGAVAPWRAAAAPFGAVFQADVRVAGRRAWTYWSRGLYALLLLAFAVLTYAGISGFTFAGSVAQRVQMLQTLAPRLALTIAFVQFFALALIAPTLTAGAICDERRSRTLPALLTTPLSSADIVMGKLAGRLAMLLVLAMISAPLLLALRLFGGLDASAVLGGTAVTLAQAVCGASIGLLLSVWHQRAPTAVIFAILCIALTQAGPITSVFIGWMLATDMQREPSEALVYALLPTCSPMALASTVVPEFRDQLSRHPLGHLLWLGSVAYNLVLSIVFVMLASFALRRVMAREASGLPPVAIGRRRRRRTATSPESTAMPAMAAGDAASTHPAETGPSGAVVAHARVAQSGVADAAGPSALAQPTGAPASRVVGDRPVLWREVRQAAFRSARSRWLALLGGAAALLVLYIAFGIDEMGLHPTIASIAMAGLILQAALLTTGGISGERESRTWSLLLTTTLTPGEIIWGKFAGAIRRQWFAGTLLAAHFVVAVVAGEVAPAVLVHTAMIVAGPVVLLSGTGILLSLVFTRSTPAAVCNLGLAMMLWLGSWFVLGMIGFTFGGPTAEALAEFNFFLSPIAMVVTSTLGNFDAAFRQGGFWQFETPGGNLGLGEFTAVLAAVNGAYVLGGLGALLAARRLFGRLAWRER